MRVGVLLVCRVLVVIAEPQWSPSPATFPETPRFTSRGWWRGLLEPQPTDTPSPSLIGRERPPPSPASLVCRRRSVCVYVCVFEKRGVSERGSSQCNGIEEREEEEEESE